MVRELASRRDLTSDQARWVGRFATYIERLPLAPPIAEVTLRISDSSESVGAVRTISLSRDSLVLSSEIGRPSSGSSTFHERHTTLVASMAGRVCDSRAELADWLGVLRTFIRGDHVTLHCSLAHPPPPPPDLPSHHAVQDWWSA